MSIWPCVSAHYYIPGGKMNSATAPPHRGKNRAPQETELHSGFDISQMSIVHQLSTLRSFSTLSNIFQNKASLWQARPVAPRFVCNSWLHFLQLTNASTPNWFDLYIFLGWQQWSNYSPIAVCGPNNHCPQFIHWLNIRFHIFRHCKIADDESKV